MKNILLLGLWLMALGSLQVRADVLSQGSIYRLGITVNELQAVGSGTTSAYNALKRSKFYVISTLDAGGYIIRFEKIYADKADTTKNWVKYGEAYQLPQKIGGIIDVSDVSSTSLMGLSSGPLVVPFKFRLNDDSFTGDAGVGFYAGVTFEPGCVTDNWCFRITPLISAGVSQVSVTTAGESEYKSSATWAAGFLITDWSNMNIGLIYGQDRIGDDAWEYEGEGWVSFMIGWQM